MIKPFKTQSCLLITAIAAASTWLLAPQVFAATQLQEVVVEAQKKIETVTETPIAISAITGDQFQKQASFNFQDVARSTPGLSFEGGVTPDIHLRGVSTVTRAPTALRVNIYQDGTLITQPRVALDQQYDIERFEILRGPQGTLYGKSSPTGTINIRTRNPNMRNADGYVSVSAGQRELFNTQFGVSVPLIDDELAVRIAGVYDENASSGQKNITRDETPKSRSNALRMNLLWQPTDAFDARLSYSYREKKENPWYTIRGAGYRADDLKVVTNESDLNESRDELAILEMNYAFDNGFALTLVSSYQKQNFENFQDPDGTRYAQNTQDVLVHVAPIWQHDLRLASEDNDFWDWQVGLYYGTSNSSTTVADVQSRDLTGSFVTVTATNPQFKSEDRAIYTHNTFKLSDELNLIVGARYQETHADNSQPSAIFRQGVATPLVPTFNALYPEARELNAYAPTGTLKLQYFFSPDLVGYVSYDRAFRAGAANLNISTNLPRSLAVIEPERSDSVELGLKGSFWEQRGRFALALYDQIYKNFQQDIVNVTTYRTSTPVGPFNLASVVASAKETETRGIEAEVGYLLTENFDVNLALTFIDAKYNDFKENPCSPGTAGCDLTSNAQLAPDVYGKADLSGERLPLASRWSGVFSSNYSLPLNSGMDWYFNSLLKANSSQIDELTREDIAGYATVDLFTGLRAGDKTGWDVNLWVKNAFDKRVVTRIFKRQTTALPNGQPIADFDMVFTNLPRQVGITGTYRFD